jgi:hypothetical protein
LVVVTFSIRAWLASQIRCWPEDLSILERSADGALISFGRDGEFFGQVHLTQPHRQVPSLQTRRVLIASWIDGSAQHVLRDDSEVVW